MLHGEIKINDKPIIVWEAVRQEDLKSKDQISNYEVMMRSTEDDDAMIVTNISHRYSDGAAVLVGKIMEAWPWE
jgi:hypothetical protein